MKQQDARIKKAKIVIAEALRKKRLEAKISRNAMREVHGIGNTQFDSIEKAEGYNIDTVLKYIDSIADDKQQWIKNLDKVIDLIFEV